MADGGRTVTWCSLPCRCSFQDRMVAQYDCFPVVQWWCRYPRHRSVFSNDGRGPLPPTWDLFSALNWYCDIQHVCKNGVRLFLKPYRMYRIFCLTLIRLFICSNWNDVLREARSVAPYNNRWFRKLLRFSTSLAGSHAVTPV